MTVGPEQAKCKIIPTKQPNNQPTNQTKRNKEPVLKELPVAKEAIELKLKV